MIDLHLHTTASDGRSTPDALVAEAASAGIDTLAVTDHDTVAAVDAVRAAAGRAGLDDDRRASRSPRSHDGRDVHVLGYFLDANDAELSAFLAAQRASRRQRVTEILARLEALGVAVDASALLSGKAIESDASVGRPLVAQALVLAGHATDVADAFDRYLGTGRPAFIPRIGPSVRDVVERVARAHGVSSLAHPGKIENDDLVRGFVRDGVDGDRSASSRSRRGGGRAISGAGRVGRAARHRRVRLPWPRQRPIRGAWPRRLAAGRLRAID